MNQNSFLTRKPVVALFAIGCCFLWGSAFPCIKIGYKLFFIPSDSVGSQLLFAGYRFTLAGILVILAGSLLNRTFLRPQKSSWGMVVKLSLVQTVLQYVFFYVGLANTSGVKSSIIEGSNVFLVILAACLIARYEKLTLKKFIGCLIGFSGVVLINLNGTKLDPTMSFLGEGCILLSAVAYAFSSLLIKSYSQKEHPVVLSGYQFFLGGIFLILIGFASGGRVTGFSPASTALLLYMAFISAAAYTVWGILLKYNPVGQVSIFGFTNPIFGVLLSALLLGEGSQAFGLKGLAALALVSAGIFLVNRETA